MLPFSSPGDRPNPRIKPASPALADEFLTREAHHLFYLLYCDLNCSYNSTIVTPYCKVDRDLSVTQLCIFSSFPCNWHTWYEEEYLSISKVPSLSLRSMMRWWVTSQKNEWMNFFFFLNLDLTRECSFSWKTTDLLCCCSVAQSCLTLCDPMNGSMPGFSVHCLPDCSNSRPLSR